MNYHFICPICDEWHSVNWNDRYSKQTCPTLIMPYQTPRPFIQHSAYVDEHYWPEEMEKTVIAIKGSVCCVPGCLKPYETLDHRIPYSNEGPTSVENLWPMCIEHNQSKGDKSWGLWMLLRR